MYDLDDHTIYRAAGLLSRHGPQTVSRWSELIVEYGITDPRRAAELAEAGDDPITCRLADGRVGVVDALAEGRVLTHRLSAAEIAVDVLDAVPDLEIFLHLEERSPGIELVFPETGAAVLAERGIDDPRWCPEVGLLLEPGALSGRRPGDLIGVRASWDALFLETVDAEEVSAPADLPARLAATIGLGTRHLLDDVVWQLMADDPAAFTDPAPPLTELLAAADLQLSGSFVIHSGLDFSS